MSGWQPEGGASIVEFDFPFNAKAPESVEEEKEESEEVQVVNTGIGLLPDAVYNKQLPPVAAAIRRRILSSLAWESDVLSRMQVRLLSLYSIHASAHPKFSP